MASTPRPVIKTTKTASSAQRPSNDPTKSKKSGEKPAPRKKSRMTADVYAAGKGSKFGKELGNALVDTVSNVGRTRKTPSQALGENLDDRLKRK